MKDDINKLFEGVELSEEIQEKVSALVEEKASVIAEQKIVDAQNVMDAEFNDKLSEAVALQLEEKTQEEIDAHVVKLQEKVSDFLDYVIKEWVSENEVAIESGVKTQIAENVLSGFHGILSNNNMNIPEGSDNVVEELESKVQELKDRLSEETDNNIKLQKQVNESEKENIVFNMCDDLADTQVEKMLDLVEDVSFDNKERFENKVSMLKEKYFGEKETSDNLDESDNNGSNTTDTPSDYMTNLMAKVIT